MKENKIQEKKSIKKKSRIRYAAEITARWKARKIRKSKKQKLATRLGYVINSIVNPDQTGYLKGRNIQDNLRIMQDLIDYTQADNLPGIVCASDFKAAFNSVEHSFLFHALRMFGFGDSFIRWIKLLYNDTELAVINNGYTSEWFKPKRGVMQGCPIFGMLFLLAVELLAIKIRNSDRIKGIQFDNVAIKMSQYCDDTTVFLQDEESVTELVKLLKKYGDVSGLELNVNKSKLLWLGSARNCTRDVAGIPAVQRLKILGLWFSATQNCEKDNLDPAINSIISTINMWSQRDLSIKGRITVTKSLLIAKLIYILPCVNLSSNQLNQIHSRIMRYTWRGRPPKVASDALCQDIAEGGLGAMDVRLLYRSLRLGFVKRMLRDDTAWAKLLQARCLPIKLIDLLKARYTPRELEKFRIAPFYREVLGDYRKTNTIVAPSCAAQARRELLWLNDCIRCENIPFLDRNMYACGIKYLDDLLHSTGALFNFDEFKQKYPNCRISFLRYLGITSSIPRQWKHWLVQQDSCAMKVDEKNSPFLKLNNKLIPIPGVTTKQFYNLMKCSVKPTAMRRWENEGLSPENWSEIFYVPYNCTISTKLQSFQYQVLHRYIPTKKFLHLRGVVSSPCCANCDRPDTMTHYFFACQLTSAFWRQVFALVNAQLVPRRVACNVPNVIFGVPDFPPVVNLVILLGKHYIYLRKLGEQALNFQAFKAYLRSVYDTEKYVARSSAKKKRAFSAKWNMLRHLLEE